MTNDGCHIYCPALVIILEATIHQFLAWMSDILGDSASGPAALAGVISRRRFDVAERGQHRARTG